METVCSSDFTLSPGRIQDIKTQRTEYGSILIFQGSVPYISTGKILFCEPTYKEDILPEQSHRRIEVALSTRNCYRTL